MSLFSREKKPVLPADVEQTIDDLRRFEDRLLGWRVSGVEAGDLHGLLLRAAEQLEDLARASEGPT